MSYTVNDLIPAKFRKPAYLVFALLGVAFGATQTGYATAGVEVPLALTVAFQVYLYVGGAFGLVAAANTVKPSAQVVGIPAAEVDIEPEVEGVLEEEPDFLEEPRHAE